MQLLEVRCCCHPLRLLGWMRLHDDVHVHPGARIKFRMPGYARAIGSGLTGVDIVLLPSEVLELEVAEWADGWNRGVAFKSDEVPLEQLRRVPGFLEAPGAADS